MVCLAVFGILFFKKNAKACKKMFFGFGYDRLLTQYPIGQVGGKGIQTKQSNQIKKRCTCQKSETIKCCVEEQ